PVGGGSDSALGDGLIERRAGNPRLAGGFGSGEASHRDPHLLRVGALRRRAGPLAVRRPRGAGEVSVAASGSAVVGAVVSVTISVPVSETEGARGSWGNALPAVSVAISETKASAVASQRGSCGIAVAVSVAVSEV